MWISFPYSRKLLHAKDFWRLQDSNSQNFIITDTFTQLHSVPNRSENICVNLEI